MGLLLVLILNSIESIGLPFIYLFIVVYCCFETDPPASASQVVGTLMASSFWQRLTVAGHCDSGIVTDA